MARLATELGKGLSENLARTKDLIAAEKHQLAKAHEQLEDQANSAIEQLESEFTRRLEIVRREFEDAVETLEQRRGEASDQAVRQQKQAIEGADDDCEHAIIQLRDQLQHDQQQLKSSQQANLRRCQQGTAKLVQIGTHVQSQLDQRGVPMPELSESEVPDAKAWSTTLLRQLRSTDRCH